MMLQISSKVMIPDDEIIISAVRSRGPGGQNINKVSTAIHLRFDIRASSLPAYYKSGLLKLRDRRINKDGIIVIKAQRFRSQEKNREEALQRLQQLVCSVSISPKRRVATKPTRRSQIKRLDTKNKRGRDKALRRKIVSPANSE